MADQLGGEWLGGLSGAKLLPAPRSRGVSLAAAKDNSQHGGAELRCSAVAALSDPVSDPSWVVSVKSGMAQVPPSIDQP